MAMDMVAASWIVVVVEQLIGILEMTLATASVEMMVMTVLNLSKLVHQIALMLVIISTTTTMDSILPVVVVEIQ
jgi:hypothetical protein